MPSKVPFSFLLIAYHDDESYMLIEQKDDTLFSAFCHRVGAVTSVKGAILRREHTSAMSLMIFPRQSALVSVSCCCAPGAELTAS